jgi:hypothetical protein
VISGCLCNCGSPRTSHARQNMAALKKHFEFYTSSFAKVRALIAGQNPFSQRKNLPNTGETQLVPTGEMDQKIAISVTTSHLFWPNQRRKASSLLPSSLRNFDFPPCERREGGGGSAARTRQKTSMQKRTRNFLPNGSPTLIMAASKKRAATSSPMPPGKHLT